MYEFLGIVVVMLVMSCIDSASIDASKIELVQAQCVSHKGLKTLKFNSAFGSDNYGAVCNDGIEIRLHKT